MAKSFHLIVVGKLKDSHLESIEHDYLKRIKDPDLQIHEVKATAENKDQEGEAVLKKIQELGLGHVIALSEWGKRHTSVSFSSWLKDLVERPQKVGLIISGAEGFSDALLAKCQEKISLSELTYPHKLARILLVEQIYRAQTIRTGHPYHN